MYHESDYELLSRLCPISWCYKHIESVDHSDLPYTEYSVHQGLSISCLIMDSKAKYKMLQGSGLCESYKHVSILESLVSSKVETWLDTSTACSTICPIS